MHFVDLTQVALRTLQSSTSSIADNYDHDQAHCLRGKILGVLIRLGRLAAERTAEDCARYLSVEPQLIEAWELGKCVPSLPQLEGLAEYFKTANSDLTLGATALPQPEREEYLRLRQRLLGALLLAARRAQETSIEDISAITGLDVDLLKRYEYGESTIPVHHLTMLAQSVEQDLSYFTDTGGFSRIRKQASSRKSTTATEDDAELIHFAKDFRNRAFIRLAMAFRDIDRDDLDRIADALLAIIRERRDANGQSHTRP